MTIKSKIRTIPNFPKDGIMFRDITTLLKCPTGLKDTIDLMVKRYEKMNVDYICGIEARGFILGSALAYQLNKGFIPIRKKGKLPGKTISQDYSLEYGTDTMEIHEDAIERGKKVLLIDDLLATGGTILGAIKLMNRIEAEILECCFIVDLPDLGGSQKLIDQNIPFYKMVDFEGE